MLVDCVQRILYRDALHVAGRDLQAQGEVQVDLLDRGVDEVEFEDVLVFDGGWGGVELPVR